MRESNEYVKALWLLLGGAAAIIGFFLLMLLMGCKVTKVYECNHKPLPKQIIKADSVSIINPVGSLYYPLNWNVVSDTLVIK